MRLDSLKITFIIAHKFDKLDIKQLKRASNIFRVYKGDVRIIFQKSNEVIRILAIERRNEQAYS